MEVKERFCKKIYEELQSFQKGILRKSKEDILGNSYKNEVLVNLYYVLLEVADDFSEALLSNLVNQSVNILESLYSNFLHAAGEDVLYEELREHVKQEFEEHSEDEYNWWQEYVEGE